MHSNANVDTSAAEAYEAFLVPGAIAPWAEVVVSDARIKEGMHVLDVACGTGIVARHVARRAGSNGRVVGIDIDEGMMSVARTISMKEGSSIEYECASASELPFSAESFDAVLCSQGLQYFPDPLAALRELHRVLRDDGVFVSATWNELENSKGHWAIVSALERRNIDAAAVRKPFACASANELLTLASEAGFKNVSSRVETRFGRFRSSAAFVDAMLRGSTSSRHAIEKVPSADWPSFRSDVESMLKPWSGAAGIEFPMQCNVLVAHR